MKFTFFILFVFIKLYSQEKTQILNSKDNTVVPFVNIWCERSKFGTSSNENGFFEISRFNDNDTLVLSSIGFETKKILFSKDTKTILLNPSIEELKEIVLVSKKIKAFKINKIKKANFIIAFGENEPTSVIAKYFPYDSKYLTTPFVNSIEFNTLTSVKNNIVNIHLYEASENGEPGKYLITKNLIYEIQKGNNTTKINLSNLNIEFPEKGLFVGVEVPKIEINEVKENQTTKEYKIYTPLIKMSSIESIKDTWLFKNGKWEINQKLSLALELKLSN